MTSQHSTGTERETVRPREHVRADDPTLSPEANAALTEELRDAVGADEDGMAQGSPVRTGAADSGPARASAKSNRMGIVLSAFVLGVVGVIVSLATGSWLALAAALVAHAIGTLGITVWTLAFTAQSEHASPALSARLEEEGVRDPDGLLTEMAAAYDSPAEADRTEITPSPRVRD